MFLLLVKEVTATRRSLWVCLSHFCTRPAHRPGRGDGDREDREKEREIVDVMRVEGGEGGYMLSSGLGGVVVAHGLTQTLGKGESLTATPERAEEEEAEEVRHMGKWPMLLVHTHTSNVIHWPLTELLTQSDSAQCGLL